MTKRKLKKRSSRIVSGDSLVCNFIFAQVSSYHFSLCSQERQDVSGICILDKPTHSGLYSDVRKKFKGKCHAFSRST